MTMTDEIKEAVYSVLHKDVYAVRSLGAGEYGKVYAALTTGDPDTVAVKIYNRAGDNVKEALWYAALARSGVDLPHIYGTYDGQRSCIVMEYVNGCNASDSSGLDKRGKDRIGEQIARAAATIHSLQGTGFGSVCNETDLRGGTYDSWTDFYAPLAMKMSDNIACAHSEGLLSRRTVQLAEYAAANIAKFTAGSIIRPCLIHGDLNVENIMIDKKQEKLLCVIDPIDSMWGDPECELFQLSERGGDKYSIMRHYSDMIPLSDNYPLKSACYALLAEGNYYADVRRRQDAALDRFVSELDLRLSEYGYKI